MKNQITTNADAVSAAFTDICDLAERSRQAGKPMSKLAALNLFARQVAGPGRDWGYLKRNHESVSTTVPDDGSPQAESPFSAQGVLTMDDTSWLDAAVKRSLAYLNEVGSELIFPRQDWEYLVSNGDEERGYAEWVENEVEMRLAFTQRQMKNLYRGEGDCHTLKYLLEDLASASVDLSPGFSVLDLEGKIIIDTADLWPLFTIAGPWIVGQPVMGMVIIDGEERGEVDVREWLWSRPHEPVTSSPDVCAAFMRSRQPKAINWSDGKSFAIEVPEREASEWLNLILSDQALVM